MDVGRMSGGRRNPPINNIYSNIPRRLPEVISVITEYVDEEGILRLDKVTKRRIAEKLKISERQVERYIAKLVELGILEYIQDGLYRMSVGRREGDIQGISPFIPIGIEKYKKKLIYAPDIVDPEELRSIYRRIFECVYVHHIQLHFLSRYENWGTKDGDIYLPHYGRTNITINLQGKDIQISLPEFEFEDTIDALIFVASLIVHAHDIAEQLTEKYGYYIERPRLINCEIALVYRDIIAKIFDFRSTEAISYTGVTIKRTFDKSKGKWELELKINAEYKDFSSVLFYLINMSSKVVWMFLLKQDQILEELYYRIDRIEKLLQLLLSKNVENDNEQK